MYGLTLDGYKTMFCCLFRPKFDDCDDAFLTAVKTVFDGCKDFDGRNDIF